jgi:uncharacterized membrane protein
VVGSDSGFYAVIQWLRRNFVTGFFVIVPLVVSLAALVWIFTLVDDFVMPVYERQVGFRVPGLGIATTALLVLLVGVAASNVIGRRLLKVLESMLHKVPVFRTIYSPVRQLVGAFSPDNESGFKRVVLVEDARRGMALGFLTKEFTLDRGGVPVALLAVYVPTNNLYLGDVYIVPRASAVFPDLTVEEGVRIILTGGMAIPEAMRGAEAINLVRDARR